MTDTLAGVISVPDVCPYGVRLHADAATRRARIAVLGTVPTWFGLLSASFAPSACGPDPGGNDRHGDDEEHDRSEMIRIEFFRSI